MSTIFGMISNTRTIDENLFKKMKNAMIDNDYKFYKDSHYIVATTQEISKDGQYTFCGRIRNIDNLRKKINKEEASVFEIYNYYQSIDYFDGHFIYIIKKTNDIYIYKDALGVESLYYYYEDDILYFSSEIKGLLVLKEKWKISKDGLLQVLSLLPSLDVHKTPYNHIYHLGPGEYLHLSDSLTRNKWWKIKEQVQKKERSEIIKDIKMIVETSIEEDFQGTSNCMLSGGLDSSIIVSVGASKKQINTYDVKYSDNEKHFKAYAYQTTQDQPFIELMKKKYPIYHQTIELTPKDLSDYLTEVLVMRDLPGMVDIDTSLFLFIASIKEKAPIILSGECADELFGGYPWYYMDTLNNTPYFPWMRHLDIKNDLILDEYDIEKYIREKKAEFLENTICNSKNQLVYLTTHWFMQTLIIRGDVIGRACHVDIRMPFASKPLFEYLWNVQWEDMYVNETEKYLLREAFKDKLPHEIYSRKKNPFPKTHSPVYLDCVLTLLESALKEKDSILYQLFKKEKLEQLIRTKAKDIEFPWFGQLMTGPQFIAFLYTIHLWSKIYPIEIDL